MARAIRLAAAALLALSGLSSAPASAQTVCKMSAADRAWLEQALANWQAAETEWLKLPSAPLPEIVAIDGSCTYFIEDGDFTGAISLPHGDTVELPGGPEMPVAPISFAMGGDAFVMSLPSVWRAAGVTSEVGLEKLMDGVLLHEISHVQQSALANAAFAPLEKIPGLADQLSDDLLQQRLEKNTAYVADYEKERDALFAAAAAPSDEEARTLAGQALELMRARHAKWFTGDSAYYAQLDDVFLTMEGMGQWLIYRYFTSPKGGALAPDAAIREVRRGGRWWSQDEGLALMLLVDRLVPEWQARAYREPDWRAERLLAAAAAGK